MNENEKTPRGGASARPEMVSRFGVRAYRYYRTPGHRVTLHLPAGASALDLTVSEMKELLEELLQLTRE